jgi:extradiol dioxygenase family protein
MTRPINTSAFHLAIAVRDLEKSRAFYQRLFAMTPTLETDEVVLLTTPARREQLALQRKPNVTIDADTWNHHGVHFTLKWLKVKVPKYREGERGWEPNQKS